MNNTNKPLIRVIEAVNPRQLIWLTLYAIASILAGAPVATDLLGSVVGGSMNYGKALVFGLAALLAGSFIMAVLLLGLKTFFKKEGVDEVR